MKTKNQRRQSGNSHFIIMTIIVLFFVVMLGITYWQNITIKKAAAELVEKANKRKADLKK